MEVPCGATYLPLLKPWTSLHWLFPYLYYQTSSLFAKAESCTCVFFQTYPFFCGSFEGSTLTFQVIETAQKKYGPHANLDLFPLTSCTQQFDLGCSLSLTTTFVADLLLPHLPNQYDAKIQLLTFQLCFNLSSLILSSGTTFGIAALLSRCLPGHLLPQKPHWLSHLSSGRGNEGNTRHRAWIAIVHLISHSLHALCVLYILFPVLTTLQVCEWLFLRLTSL